jgi:acyl-CoA thioesterase-1
MLARLLIFHVASGQAFFTGAGCLLAALGLDALSNRPPSRAWRVGRNVLVLLGLAGVGVAPAPLGWWVYGLVGVATLGWLVLTTRHGPGRSRTVVRCLAALAWVGAVAMEAPYHGTPRGPALASSPVVLGIVADSITAGMNQPRITTWPRLLAGGQGDALVVRDHSLPGATTATALRDQAPAVGADETVVWIEIGGNDLLGGVSGSEFGANLDRLLRTLARPGRLLVMMELPLIPGARGYAYGLAQRRLARQYGARLIPRRVLTGILLSPGATQDTVHLTQAGHERMARVVGEWLRPVLAVSGRSSVDDANTIVPETVEKAARGGMVAVASLRELGQTLQLSSRRGYPSA